MAPIINCCIDNLSTDLYNELKATDATVTRQYCLQRCWCCHDSSFVVVDGEVVTAADEDTLRGELEEAELLHMGGST